MAEFIINNNRFDTAKPTIYAEFMDNILNSKTDEDIKEIVKDLASKDVATYKASLNSYIRKYKIANPDCDINKIEEELTLKIAKARLFIVERSNSIRNKEKEAALKQKDFKEKLDSIKAICNITKFIVSDYQTLKEYAFNEKLNLTELDYELELIAKRNPVTYSRYNDKMNMIALNKKAYVASILNPIIDKVKNGVNTENDKIRAYDVIDFYNDTNMNANEFTKIAINLCPGSDYALLRRIIYTESNDYLMHDEFTESDADKVNYKIADKVTTDLDKEIVLKYLSDNHIPLTYYTFITGVKRQVNGQLIDSKTYIKK